MLETVQSSFRNSSEKISGQIQFSQSHLYVSLENEGMELVQFVTRDVQGLKIGAMGEGIGGDVVKLIVSNVQGHKIIKTIEVVFAKRTQLVLSQIQN